MVDGAADAPALGARYTDRRPGVLAAIFAAVVDRYIPWMMPGRIGADAVDSILTIIASSMLAVTLSRSTSWFQPMARLPATSPRVHQAAYRRRLTQTVLSTFIGSFLFSIVGLVVLKPGAYGERGRVVLFVFTIVVITLVVVSFAALDRPSDPPRPSRRNDRTSEEAAGRPSSTLAEPISAAGAVGGRAESRKR